MLLARARIVSLLPTPAVTPEVHARLAAAPPDALTSLALDTGHRWWRRLPCALALRGGPLASIDTEAPGAEAALPSAGFRSVDAAFGRITVAGLHVYHFGAPDLLTSGELLFYRQD